jgi:hypothetical protein
MQFAFQRRAYTGRRADPHAIGRQSAKPGIHQTVGER